MDWMEILKLIDELPLEKLDQIWADLRHFLT